MPRIESTVRARRRCDRARPGRSRCRREVALNLRLKVRDLAARMVTGCRLLTSSSNCADSIGTSPLPLVGVTAVVIRDEKVLRRAPQRQRRAARRVTGHRRPGRGARRRGRARVPWKRPGVVIRAERLALGAHRSRGSPTPTAIRSDYLDLTFRCSWVSGDPHPADGELTEVGWYDLEALGDAGCRPRAPHRARRSPRTIRRASRAAGLTDQLRSSRISTRGKPLSTESVSAALRKPAFSNSCACRRTPSSGRPSRPCCRPDSPRSPAPRCCAGELDGAREQRVRDPLAAMTGADADAPHRPHVEVVDVRDPAHSSRTPCRRADARPPSRRPRRRRRRARRAAPAS